MSNNTSSTTEMPASSSATHSDAHAKEYKQALDVFINYWGEMSSAWGINRTMAQIYALLFAEPAPIDTDTIMEKLKISRGNANMNVRNLIEWGLVHKTHISGERRDFFTSEKDLWTTAARIIGERQRREISPIQQTLTRCTELLKAGPEDAPEVRHFKKRLDSFTDFLQLFNDFSEAVLPYISEKNVDQIKGIVEMAKQYQLQQESEAGSGQGGTSGC
ncbi:MAG: GbsR/MarR family transcriptional regulator [Cyclonatronaceae bacterium]